MLRLGQTTTGHSRGVKYLWLCKDMEAYRTFKSKSCYLVMAFNGKGWYTLFAGTLAECRKYIGDSERVVW